MTEIPVTIRLRPEVNGLPYAHGKPDQINGMYVYWRQFPIGCTHDSIWIGTVEDINVTKAKTFDAVIMRSTADRLGDIAKALDGFGSVLLNGNEVSGYVAKRGYKWEVDDATWCK